MNRLFHLIAAITVTVSAFDVAVAQTKWVGPKRYMPPATTLNIPGFGINTTIDVLPPGTTAITVNRDLENVSGSALAAGYPTTDLVTRMIFRKSAGSAGWQPGPGPAYTVGTFATAGPALAPKAMAPVAFGPIPTPGCGMYHETLTAPGDKQGRYFLIPGKMKVSVAVVPPGQVDTPETQGAKIKITFTGSPGSMFRVFGPTHLPVQGSEGSIGQFVPPPPGGPVAKFTTTYRVTPKNLGGKPPCTDILRHVNTETVNSLLTAITVDGCFIQQAAVNVTVLHECR